MRQGEEREDLGAGGLEKEGADEAAVEEAKGAHMRSRSRGYFAKCLSTYIDSIYA